MMKKSRTFTLLLRASAFARPHRGYIILISVATLLSAAAGSVEPYIMKCIFDGLGAHPAISWFVSFIALLAGVALFKEAVNVLSNYLGWRIRLDIHYALLDAAVERIHRFPPHIHRTMGVGAIMTRLDRSIQGVISAFIQIAFQLFPAVAYIVFSIVLMASLEWHLTLLTLAFVPLPALAAMLAAPRQVHRERTLMDRWIAIYSRFNEVLTGILTVRSFAMEQREKNRFLDDVKQANRIVKDGIRFDSGVEALQNMITMAARIAAIGYGGYLVLTGHSTLGTVIAFAGYVNGMFAPVQGLTGVYRILKTASVSLEQLFEILDTEYHVPDAVNASEIHGLSGHVRFDHVSFGFDSAAAPLLHDITFEARQGEMIAIVGPSGSGKTTLMALLQRFFDPTGGAVLVDGKDIRGVKQLQLRRHIGVVLQDCLLFNESVRDNIAYGNPGASLQEIEKASRAAQAHDFVVRLPEGYSSLVGERGSRLSAGERQRIAIARALLKNPAILILDEATASLDAETEALVQAALDTMIAGRTTFVIAHRLSTVIKADRIVVLRHGRIAESGTHEALCRSEGYYASLVQRQVRGLLRAA